MASRWRTWDIECLDSTLTANYGNSDSELIEAVGKDRGYNKLSISSIVLPKAALIANGHDPGFKSSKHSGRGRSLKNRALSYDKPSRRPGEKDQAAGGGNPGLKFLGSKYLYEEFFPGLNESKAPNDSHQSFAPSATPTSHDQSKQLKNDHQSTQPAKPLISFAMAAKETRLLKTTHPSFESPTESFIKDKSLSKTFPQPVHFSGNLANSTRPKSQSANHQLTAHSVKTTIPTRPIPPKNSFQEVCSSRKTVVRPSQSISCSNYWSSIENKKQTSKNSHQSRQPIVKYTTVDKEKQSLRSNQTNKVSADGFGKDDAKPSASHSNSKQLSKDNTNAELPHDGKLPAVNTNLSEHDYLETKLSVHSVSETAKQLYIGSQSTAKPNISGTDDSKATDSHNIPTDNWDLSRNDHLLQSSVNFITNGSVKLTSVKHQSTQPGEMSNSDPSTMSSDVDILDDDNTNKSDLLLNQLQDNSDHRRKGLANDCLPALTSDNFPTADPTRILYNSTETTQLSSNRSKDDDTKKSNTGTGQTTGLPDTFPHRGLDKMSDTYHCNFLEQGDVVQGNIGLLDQDHLASKLLVPCSVDNSSKSQSTDQKLIQLEDTCVPDPLCHTMLATNNPHIADATTPDSSRVLDNSNTQSNQAQSHDAIDDSRQLSRIDCESNQALDACTFDSCTETSDDICLPEVDKTIDDKTKVFLNDNQSKQSLSHSALDDRTTALQLDISGSDPNKKKLDYGHLPTINTTTIGDDAEKSNDGQQSNTGSVDRVKLAYADDHLTQITDAYTQLSGKELSSVQLSINYTVDDSLRPTNSHQQSNQQENDGCTELSSHKGQSFQLPGQSSVEDNSKPSSINHQSTQPSESSNGNASSKLSGSDNKAVQLPRLSSAKDDPTSSSIEQQSSKPVGRSNGNALTKLSSRDDQSVQLSEESTAEDRTNVSNVDHQSNQQLDNPSIISDVNQSDDDNQSTLLSDTLAVRSDNKLWTSHTGAFTSGHEKSPSITKLNPGTVDPKTNCKENQITPTYSEEEVEDTDEMSGEPCDVKLENLPLTLTEEDLQEIVEPYGSMISCTFKEENASKTSIVRMADSVSGEWLATSLDGLEIGGRRMQTTLDI